MADSDSKKLARAANISTEELKAIREELRKRVEEGKKRLEEIGYDLATRRYINKPNP